ncbi:hypothetical protein CR513_49467, partial [Mucuna pruriens]
MQKFRTRGTIAPRMVNEFGTIDNLRLENQLTELISLVTRNIVVSGSSNPISCFDNSSSITNNSDSIEYSSTNNFAELE